MSKLYSINVIDINGEVREDLATRAIQLEFICKGGFRFLAEETLDLDDRVRVRLKFPDDSTKEVYGRICYCDVVDEQRNAYGFSVLNGFYTLHDDAIAA
jgi:hypothetical protein